MSPLIVTQALQRVTGERFTPPVILPLVLSRDMIEGAGALATVRVPVIIHRYATVSIAIVLVFRSLTRPVAANGSGDIGLNVTGLTLAT